MLSFKHLVISMTIVQRIVHGLDRDEADSTKNENCSHYLSELPRKLYCSLTLTCGICSSTVSNSYDY